MNIIASIKSRWTFDQRIILFNILLLLLPYYISAYIYIIEIIYLVFSKKAITGFKNTPNSKYLLFTLGLALGVSVLYQNWIGVAISFFVLCFFIFMFHYRMHITKDLFEYILDMLIVMSIAWAIYGFIEYLIILRQLGYEKFVIEVFSLREERLNSVMLNANYYASVIEMVILAIIYKMTIHHKNIKRILFYFLVLLINVFILYLDGSRTSWPAIAGALFVYFILTRNYKICSIYVIGAIGIIVYFLLNIDKIPRIDDFSKALGYRGEIWHTAWLGIKDHPIFGLGPGGYYHIIDQYNGHVTHHSHNILLELLISYGVIGTAMLSKYAIGGIVNIKKCFKYHPQYTAFITAIITTTLIHGISDFSIFFIHPGMIFFYLVSSSSAFNNK